MAEYKGLDVLCSYAFCIPLNGRFLGEGQRNHTGSLQSQGSTMLWLAEPVPPFPEAQSCIGTVTEPTIAPSPEPKLNHASGLIFWHRSRLLCVSELSFWEDS